MHIACRSLAYESALDGRVIMKIPRWRDCANGAGRLSRESEFYNCAIVESAMEKGFGSLIITMTYRAS
jgi:hypothetical protein